MIKKERLLEIGRFLETRLFIHRQVEGVDKWTTEEKMICELYDSSIDDKLEINRLNNELAELKKYKEEATRKHWQQKAAEHYVNEKLYEFKINDTIEYINNNRLSKFGSIDDKDADKIIKMLGGD